MSFKNKTDSDEDMDRPLTKSEMVELVVFVASIAWLILLFTLKNLTWIVNVQP